LERYMDISPPVGEKWGGRGRRLPLPGTWNAHTQVIDGTSQAGTIQLLRIERILNSQPSRLGVQNCDYLKYNGTSFGNTERTSLACNHHRVDAS
jgi:hypothetical protein